MFRFLVESIVNPEISLSFQFSVRLIFPLESAKRLISSQVICRLVYDILLIYFFVVFNGDQNMQSTNFTIAYTKGQLSKNFIVKLRLFSYPSF